MTDTTITHWTRLGSDVRDARITRQWSQAELATRANVSRPWVSKVETGHRRAELEQLLRVFAALNLTFIVRDEHESDPVAPPNRNTSPGSVDEFVREERTRAAARRRASWAGAPYSGDQASASPHL